MSRSDGNLSKANRFPEFFPLLHSAGTLKRIKERVSGKANNRQSWGQVIIWRTRGLSACSYTKCWWSEGSVYPPERRLGNASLGILTSPREKA